MPCTPIMNPDGTLGGWICGPGRYTHLVLARCPWCCFEGDERPHAFREVYGGYCSPDMVCGHCGQQWTGDADALRRMSEDERDEGIALVREMAKAGVVVGDFPRPSALDPPPEPPDAKA